MWPNNLNLKVTPMISNGKRLSVVSKAIENVNVVLCNLYLPSSCANHSDKLDEYSETLNTVSGLLAELEFNYVIVGGDLNTDFKYRHLGSKAVTLFENITSKYCLLHSCDNLSDHSAIDISVAISVESFNIVMDQSTNLLWNNVTQHELNLYQNTSDKKLNNVATLKDVFSYHNFCCANSGHINHLKTLTIHCPKHRVKAKPGWNSYVEDYRCISLFWHKICSDCEKPRTGTVVDIMQKTRANYHHTIKLIKLIKQKDDIIADKIAKDFYKKGKLISRKNSERKNVTK